jgi:hypothetical protein
MTAGREIRMVAKALAAVRELGLDPESPGGAVVLAHLLLQDSTVTPHAADDASEPASTPGAGDQPAAKVAKWLGVDAERVEDVIELTADEALLRIPVRRLPKAKADRQRVLVVIKLAVERVAFERADVPASRINATCAEYACMDQNLPGNVASRGDLAARRGKRGAYSYRATQPGMERAKDLLRDLLDSEEELRV